MLECPKCGAISFVEIEKCDFCSYKAPQAETISNGKMSFKQFEAGKKKLNKLQNLWMLDLIAKPKPIARIKKLERKIADVRKKLEDNIYLVFLFNGD